LSEHVDRVTRHLNVWASRAHHMLAGGYGWPDYDRCGVALDTVRDLEAAPVSNSTGNALVWDRDRADKLYEASKRKYRGTGVTGYPTDARSQLDGLVVECLLGRAGYPPIVAGLILWIYPTAGDLAPLRPSCWDVDNPYRSFRPRLWVAETFGCLVWKYQEQTVDRLLRGIERGFRDELADALRGSPWQR
jgi:hypothetical protein